MTQSVSERLSAALSDRYRIERELGQGGMATVYLAEDLKHKRRVAVKVLKPELAAVLGAERFVVEITTTAALQHPHILPLFDSGEADGFLYYVMPFIDGETLRGKLDRETQLSVDESVRIASDVASALHYAHTQGVIHRDIKPENILLHDGRPMVADFGIALAVSAAAGGRMTETGLSLGTPHYMSPEQATAEKEITAKSDVYSLGSVLYEMLTGNPPHVGASAQQIIMKIITTPAELVTVHRKAVPAHVADAVAKSLEKLPADRFSSAKAFAEALANSAFRSATIGVTVATSSQTSGSWRTAALALGAVAVVTTSIALMGGTGGSGESRDVGLLPTAPMRMQNTKRNFAVSHDGTFIVYEARLGESSQLWYQSLIDSVSRAITGTEGAVGAPRISPDDRRIAFESEGEVKIISVDGGTATVAVRAEDLTGGGWLANGQIFFGADDGRVMRWVDAETGPARTERIGLCIHPQLMEGRNRILCGGGSTKVAYAVDPARPDERLFLRRSAEAATAGPPLVLGSDFRIVDGEYLVYMSIDGTIMGARFEDIDSLIVGRSVPLVSGVRRSAYSASGHFDITDNGTLVFVPGINAEVGRLVQWSREQGIVPLRVDEGAHLRFTPSPDGTRLGTVVEGIQEQELRIYDLRTGTHETVDQGYYLGGPRWSPDGRSIAYLKREYATPTQEKVLLRRLESPEPPRVLISGDYRANEPSSFLADDFLLLGVSISQGRNVIVDPTSNPVGIDTLPLSSFFISLSPDRKWIAYQPQGAIGVTLQPWPALDRRYQVDPLGAEPRWASANELVYLRRRLGKYSEQRVRIDASSSTPVGKPELLFDDPRFADTPGWSHSLGRNGEVVYVQTPDEILGYYVRVVPNWVKAMKRAVNEANR